MRFFTADSHFSLKDCTTVISRDFRPFKTLREMNRKIIKVWNKQVKRSDVIYHLGDFSNFNMFDQESYDKCYDLVRKIKADVVLICGNNEQRLIEKNFDGDFQKFRNYLLAKGFMDVIKDGIEINIQGQKFYLNHYPKNHKAGMENLFGHIHGTGFVKPYGFNIGIDNKYLKMFSEDDIIEMVDRRKYFDENVYN